MPVFLAAVLPEDANFQEVFSFMGGQKITCCVSPNIDALNEFMLKHETKETLSSTVAQSDKQTTIMALPTIPAAGVPDRRPETVEKAECSTVQPLSKLSAMVKSVLPIPVHPIQATATPEVSSSQGAKSVPNTSKFPPAPLPVPPLPPRQTTVRAQPTLSSNQIQTALNAQSERLKTVPASHSAATILKAGSNKNSSIPHQPLPGSKLAAVPPNSNSPVPEVKTEGEERTSKCASNKVHVPASNSASESLTSGGHQQAVPDANVNLPASNLTTPTGSVLLGDNQYINEAVLEIKPLLQNIASIIVTKAQSSAAVNPARIREPSPKRIKQEIIIIDEEIHADDDATLPALYTPSEINERAIDFTGMQNETTPRPERMEENSARHANNAQNNVYATRNSGTNIPNSKERCLQNVDDNEDSDEEEYTPSYFQRKRMDVFLDLRTFGNRRKSSNRRQKKKTIFKVAAPEKERPFLCDVCNKAFTTKGFRRRHKNRFHSLQL